MNHDLSNYASIIGEFPSVAIDLLHTFGTNGSLCFGVLVQLVEGFTTIASEEFPKSIAQLPDTDLKFQVRNRQQKKSVKDQEMWNSVGDSVVHHSIKFDNLEAHSC